MFQLKLEWKFFGMTLTIALRALRGGASALALFSVFGISSTNAATPKPPILLSAAYKARCYVGGDLFIGQGTAGRNLHTTVPLIDLFWLSSDHGEVIGFLGLLPDHTMNLYPYTPKGHKPYFVGPSTMGTNTFTNIGAIPLNDDVLNRIVKERHLLRQDIAPKTVHINKCFSKPWDRVYPKGS